MTGQTDRRVRQMFALLREADIADRADRLTLASHILSRPVTSTNDLNSIEIGGIVDTLSYWKRLGELKTRAHAALTPGGDQTMTDSQSPHVSPTSFAGHTIIGVEFSPNGVAYTYVWEGDQLHIGDKVHTPTGIGTVRTIGRQYAHGEKFTAIREKA